MGVLSLISNVFGAISNVFGFLRDKLTANNTPEMKAAAQGKTDAQQADQANADVQNAAKTGDLDQLRKDAAE